MDFEIMPLPSTFFFWGKEVPFELELIGFTMNDPYISR